MVAARNGARGTWRHLLPSLSRPTIIRTSGSRGEHCRGAGADRTRAMWRASSPSSAMRLRRALRKLVRSPRKGPRTVNETAVPRGCPPSTVSLQIQDAMSPRSGPGRTGRTLECAIDLLVGALIGLIAPVVVLVGALIVRLAALSLGTFTRRLKARMVTFGRGTAARLSARRTAAQAGGSGAAWIRNTLRASPQLRGAIGTFARWVKARVVTFGHGIAAGPSVRRPAMQPGGSRAAWIRNTLRAPPRPWRPGSDLQQHEARTCPVCGHPMSSSARFCRSCGADAQP